MFFDIIQSGSKGNSTLIFTKSSIILIDMGINICDLERELDKFNKSISDINAVFVTHNHSDHIRNIKCFSPKIIYALEGTVAGSLSNVILLNEPVFINNTRVTPFKTSHDAINPCGYIVEEDSEKLVYMTDTGVYLTKNNELVNNPNYLIIESNHNIQMLLKSHRPQYLKDRILSEHGHLCNEDSAFATLEIIGDKTKQIVLAHLSEECNTPELAIEAYKEIFKYRNVDINKYDLKCANQHISLIGGNYEN